MDALEVVSTYGGFEIAQMCGGMLRAAELGMTLLVDGFISTAAFLIAQKINVLVKEYALFSHCSNEQAHKKMLDFLDVSPILNLGMRLGEGTGCALAIPIVKSACAIMSEMASFSDAAVNKKL